VISMSVEEVCSVLSEIGVDEKPFRNYHVDGKLLATLSDQNLEAVRKLFLNNQDMR